MALPADNTPWPPAHIKTAIERFDEYNDWLIGDEETLRRRYNHNGNVDPEPGGLFGLVKRMFWGRPNPKGQTPTRLHVPIPADLAVTSADLMFGEPPMFVMTGERSKEGNTDRDRSQKRLAELMGSEETHRVLVEGAEICSALGGTYRRIVWSPDTGKPILQNVAPENAIPEWRYGQLTGVLMWQELPKRDDKLVWRLMEYHTKGRIEHALYRGTDSDVGQRVPFEDHPDAAFLEDIVDGDSGVDTGSTALTASYVPNVLPNYEWRRNPNLAMFGRSDFDGLLPLFDKIDETYSSWMRDVRLAKARVFISDQAMENLSRGKGQVFNEEQELFTAAGAMPGRADAALPIEMKQFDIRCDEHRSTIEQLLSEVLRKAGFSASSFGDDSLQFHMTATEVRARKELSARTRDKKIRYERASLTQLAQAMLEVDKAVFGGPGLGGEEPTVVFTHSPQETMSDLAQTANLMRSAEAATIETRVRLLHPDWDSTRLNTEVDGIKEEMGLNVANPETEGRP